MSVADHHRALPRLAFAVAMLTTLLAIPWWVGAQTTGPGLPPLGGALGVASTSARPRPLPGLSSISRIASIPAPTLRHGGLAPGGFNPLGLASAARSMGLPLTPPAQLVSPAAAQALIASLARGGLVPAQWAAPDFDPAALPPASLAEAIARLPAPAKAALASALPMLTRFLTATDPLRLVPGLPRTLPGSMPPALTALAGLVNTSIAGSGAAGIAGLVASAPVASSPAASVSLALASAASRLLGLPSNPTGPMATSAIEARTASESKKPPRETGHLLPGSSPAPEFADWDFRDPGLGTAPETVITADHMNILDKMVELVGKVRAVRDLDILTCNKALVRNSPQWMLATGAPRLFRKEQILDKKTTRETTIDAGNMVWDSVTRTLNASPGVVITIDERTWDLATHTWTILTADEMTGWPDQKQARLTGTVTMKQERSYGRGRRLDYDQMKHNVVLSGDAYVETDAWNEKKRLYEKRSVEGNTINYDLTTKACSSQ